MLIRILSLLLTVLSFSTQGQIRIGEWREHLPYQKAKRLVSADKKVYCLTESGLFCYSLADNEIQTFSKAKGLSESEISAIEWSENNQILLIGYSNGNLDVILNGKIVNIPDIKRFSRVDNKTINSIFTNERIAYLATGFGIVAIDLEKLEIADTYFIGNGGAKLNVKEVKISGSSIWAATNQGIFVADLSSNNLADFNNWNQLQNLPDFQKECDELVFLEDVLWLSRSLSETASEVFRYVDGNWSKLSDSFQKIHSLQVVGNQIWVVQSDFVQVFNSAGTESKRIQSTELTNLRDAIQIENRIFIADLEKSLHEIQGNLSISIKPDGPLRQDITNIFSVANQTWTVAGGINSQNEAKKEPAELFLFENQEWTNFSVSNTPEFEGKFDLLSATGNQRDQSVVYVASWGSGIFAFQNKQLSEVWNATNSPLGTTGVGAMASDQDGNLWILDANSAAPIKIHTLENKWITLNYTSLNNRIDLQKILILSNGDKWILRAPGQTLFAFNENGTLSNNDDDVSSSFFVRNEGNSIISTQVYDLLEDDNRNVWLATHNGVAIYPNPENLFRDGNFFAYRPVITIEGSTQYLLGTEIVQCIALNGANQKWLGTKNSGVYLVSENGDQQLTHFTSENSPLPSNLVQKISVNPETGEVFFVTDRGMVSYKGEVTTGNETYNKLYVYPNPVRETYHGDVVVSGLIANSTVKITDVSGNLVMEGKSLGGQFLWDGKNFNGSRVHTGVYLLFCSNSDGSKSKVIKLLFIH